MRMAAKSRKSRYSFVKSTPRMERAPKQTDCLSNSNQPVSEKTMINGYFSLVASSADQLSRGRRIGLCQQLGGRGNYRLGTESAGLASTGSVC